MKTLNLNIKGNLNKDVVLQIDNQTVKPKKNSFGNYSVNYQTEKDCAVVSITKRHELESKLWFLWQMLFFFLSIFGIFDRRVDKTCKIIDIQLEVPMQDETNLTIVWNNYVKKGEKNLDIQCDTEVKEIKNEYFVDKTAKEKLKKLRIAKIISTILLALVVVFAIIICS